MDPGNYSKAGTGVAAAAAPRPATPIPAAAAPPPAPTSPIYSDPAFLAFARASGLSDQIAAGAVARRTGNINMALNIATGDMERQGTISRRNIAGSHEARGVFRSGANLRAQGEQEAAQAARASALQLGARSDIGDLNSNLLQTIAGNQQRTVELGLTTAADMDEQEKLAKLGLT